jgi:murein tripeptide amidase MpaA
MSSRVHPGETGASWMMKGIIDYLTGPSLNAKILRDNFVFKIVPMLNIDGVVNGSSRCNLAGVDLNRCWIEPNKKIHPTIYHMKNVSPSQYYNLDDKKILRGQGYFFGLRLAWSFPQEKHLHVR